MDGRINLTLEFGARFRYQGWESFIIFVIVFQLFLVSVDCPPGHKIDRKIGKTLVASNVYLEVLEHTRVDPTTLEYVKGSWAACDYKFEIREVNMFVPQGLLFEKETQD